MAKTGYASLCVLLVLAALAQCGLGQYGSTHVHNSASRDIAHWKYLIHDDGSTTVTPQTTLAQSATEMFEVPADVKCISTSYIQLPDHLLGQVVLDWCRAGKALHCLPDCYWVINDKGFSVSGHDALVEFVSAWETWGSKPPTGPPIGPT